MKNIIETTVESTVRRCTKLSLARLMLLLSAGVAISACKKDDALNAEGTPKSGERDPGPPGEGGPVKQATSQQATSQTESEPQSGAPIEMPRLPKADDLSAYLEGLEGAGPLKVTFETTQGSIECTLFEKQVPMTVANFAGLALGKKSFVDTKTGKPAKRPYFDGLVFHRVIPNFMIKEEIPRVRDEVGLATSSATSFTLSCVMTNPASCQWRTPVATQTAVNFS